MSAGASGKQNRTPGLAGQRRRPAIRETWTALFAWGASGLSRGAAAGAVGGADVAAARRRALAGLAVAEGDRPGIPVEDIGLFRGPGAGRRK